MTPINGEEPPVDLIDAQVDGITRRPRHHPAPAEDRLPPHSIEAEQGVLGCILLSPRESLDKLPGLRIGPESFYDLRHETLLHALLAMDHARQPIDLITVQQWLRNGDQLECIGGLAYLSGLVDAVPSAANLACYAETVREKRVARRVAQIATEALSKLHDTEPEALLRQVEHDINFLSRGRPKPTAWPAPISGFDWIKPENKPPTRPEIIHGLLRRGDKLVLGGGSKSCKTWFAASLAIAISAGLPFLGFQTIKTPCLFINLELPDDVMWERMARLFLENRINPTDCDIRFWNLRGLRNMSVEELDRQITALGLKAGFIALDPLYKLLGDRSENDSSEMASLFQIIEGIAHRLNAAALIPAHFSKGNQSEKSAIDRISGSGAIGRDADALITMTAHEEDDAFTLDFTLRSYAPQPPLVIRWEYPLFKRDDSLDPASLKQSKIGRPKFETEKLLELFPDHGITVTELKESAESRFQLKRTACYVHFKQLLEQGKVTAKPGSNPTLYVLKSRYDF